MKNLITLSSVLLLVCAPVWNVIALNLPGPRVYVVTPAPKGQNDKGRSVPFYYHNWLRRMDSVDAAKNATTTSTSTTAVPKVETPDLIFAEFESDSNDGMKKSIRKLLEKEKVVSKTTTTTTAQPIFVPDEEYDKVTRVVNYGLPFDFKQEEEPEKKTSSNIDYFSMYNNLYENPAAPVFLPSTQSSTTKTTTTTTTTIPESSKIENIWHIIDSEKNNQYSDKWEEVTVDSETGKGDQKQLANDDEITEEKGDEDEFDANFALPGLRTTPGNGAENESRAIRTEPQIRFPYVSLKPFQLKPNKKPNSFGTNQKTGQNFMMNLDNFHELKNPVRGEAHDIVPMRDLIDRYNPAQPYLPPTDYGSKNSKQNSMSTPPKATANLVPPPPPPPPVPKVTGNDFPVLKNYESFPPYAAPSFDSAPPLPPSAPKPPTSMFSASSVDTSDNSNANEDSDSYSDNGPLMNVGYQYRPPAPPMQQFIPTAPPSAPPMSKPFKGYTYDKPPITEDAPEVPSMDDKPDFHGYHYNKPKEAPSESDSMPPSYGHDAPPSYGHDNDYPELIFQKNHGHGDDTKGSDDMQGMMPPPPDMKPADHGPPMDDHGFPSDFPGDFKYHHDFDDHDHFYEHHHHPTTTTTTTTTEMPRVNRYSYYYLGKKLYYLPLYFSVYFIVYVGALIIKAVLRHKIVYPNSWRPNGTTAAFFSKRSVDNYLNNDNLHEVTGKVTHAIATAAEKYLSKKSKNNLIHQKLKCHI